MSVVAYIEEKENPCLRVDQGLSDLIPFPHLVFDSGFIISNATYHVVLFLLCKEECFHRGCWKKY